MNKNSSESGKHVINKDIFHACFYTNGTHDQFQHANTLTSSLPNFVLLLFLVLVINRLLLSILKPLRQPQVVAYIICGVLLGPTAFGRSSEIADHVFPFRNIMVLETFANLALVYYMFLVGLEMDVVPIINSGTNASKIAVSGVLLPLATGFALFFLVHDKSKESDIRGCIFWAVALTTTSFPDLTRVLTNLKLLHTDIGRLALSSSVISDFCTWLLLVLSLSIMNSHSYFAMLSTFMFTLICLFVFRPLISKILRRTLEGGNMLKEQHIFYILGCVVLFGFITDACGVHSIVGGFMFGVIMPPTETIRAGLTQRLDDFVSGIMMPLFYVTTGLRADLIFTLRHIDWYMLVAIIVVSFAAKIASTLLVFLLCNMPVKQGVAVGVLMNTKGVLAMIIVNTGRNINVLNNLTFPLIVLSILVMTCLVEPIIAATYKPQKHNSRYKLRTIAGVAKPNTEFRILACIHSIRDIPCMISLLEVSNATLEFPISMLAVHLVELTGRSTAILIVHDQCKGDAINNPERTKSESEQISNTFKSYERINDAVFVQTITTISPYKTMHEDICSLAEDTHISLIIIPCYSNVTADGRVESYAFPCMNQSVLAKAPCSVGLLVDRRFGSIAQIESTGCSPKVYRIAMIFIGGPDDREALAYAWRMSGNACVNLTALRFIAGKDATKGSNRNPETDEKEKRLDDDYTNEFMEKTMTNKSISYIEKVANNGNETLRAIKEMDADYDLYIVGRGNKVNSQLTSGLSDWSSCQELGILGDTIASSNFASNASLLVVQQYIAENKNVAKELEMHSNSAHRYPLMGSTKDHDNSLTSRNSKEEDS